MRSSAIIFAVLFTAFTGFSDPLRTAGELNGFLSSHDAKTATFALTGTVISTTANWVTLKDETGTASLEQTNKPLPRVGQRISVCGDANVPTIRRIGPWANVHHDPCASVTEMHVIDEGRAPAPIQADLTDLDDKQLDCHVIETTGLAFASDRDTLSADYQILLLKEGETIVPVLFQTDDEHVFNRFVDARVRVRGVLQLQIQGSRKVRGPSIILNKAEDVEIVVPPPEDPFAAPPLNAKTYMSPREVAVLGKRSASGTVLATWQGDRFLLQTDQGRTVGVTLSADIPLPPTGTHIVAVGQPETDYFRINLADARWKADGKPACELPVYPATARRLMRDGENRPQLKAVCHGYLMRMEGTIRRVPPKDDAEARILMEDGPLTFAVDVSSNRRILDALAPDYRIEVTGICVMEANIGNFPTYAPRFTGFTLVPRSPADIRVLSRPSWWTPSRLLFVIGSLLAALVGVVIWNRSLERTVRRRTKALVREQLATTAASLKIDERTRLAAELHDSLSQNLSAVAFQVSAAKSTADGNAETLSLLATAERMLQSSRMELTRCLWDLRGDALEESNFTRAIENTLARLALKAKTVIRFNVPRERVDDTTAHAIICIVRELVTNAVKHGGADEIRVAGETHEDTISFSVRDNGTGFDPERVRGIAEGHFGLEGIRDRISRLDGTFEIKSKPGAGTKATVNLKMKRESTGNEFQA